MSGVRVVTRGLVHIYRAEGHDVAALSGIDLVVAGLVAVTLVNNYIEGAQPVLGLVFLATLLALGLHWRPAPVSRLLLAVGGIGLVLLLGWGAYWLVADGSLFPEFSELGWI